MDNNKISLSFVSAACNRLSQCIAWSREANIICYPADKNILLAEIVTEEKETYGKAIASLVGHTSRVTCLKWMSGSSSPLDHEAYFAKEVCPG